MSKFKEFKQKVKDNKGKIITSALVIGSVAFVIVKQNNVIKQLKINDAEQAEEIAKLTQENAKRSEDITVLASVMNQHLLSSMKSCLTRKLRYAEGRLNNGVISGVMTEADKMLRMEEMEFYSKELNNLDEAEKITAKYLVK